MVHPTSPAILANKTTNMTRSMKKIIMLIIEVNLTIKRNTFKSMCCYI